jgi:hypothetical protein
VIVDCDTATAATLVKRMRNGYSVITAFQSGWQSRGESSRGGVGWRGCSQRPGETMQQVDEQADATTYKDPPSIDSWLRIDEW